MPLRLIGEAAQHWMRRETMHIYAVAFGFLQPFCDEYATFTEDPAEADFVLSMNNGGHEGMEAIKSARAIADKYGIPFCWWTIEDPNAYAGFIPQAKIADYVFTSDKACIPLYRRDCRHDNIYWLPLACSERFHRLLPLRDDATDFVFSGNWYDKQWEARRWGVATVILPLARAGYSITSFSLDEPPYLILTKAPNRWIKGDSNEAPGYFSAVAEQYQYGKVVLGVNNQRSGMDGRGASYMTSMRTFEALACGKPFLAAHSDAYEALGFENWKHFVWTAGGMDAAYPDIPSILCEAKRLVGEPGTRYYTRQVDAELVPRGRAFVLANHTYGHRMRAIMEAIG